MPEILDTYFIVLILVLFSIVQSIFGVGLLLFGTPTLLLYGYSYETTLWILLPASILISFVQVISNYNLVNSKREVYFFTVPTLMVSLAFIIMNDNLVDIGKIVGAVLLFIGVMRLSSTLKRFIKIIINKNINLYYSVMGMVHGISNMGGGLLSVLMSTTYNEKDTIRTNIAYVYLIFSASQLIVLMFISQRGFQYFNIWFALIALLVYFLIGNTLAKGISNNKYHLLITVLILAYGAASFSDIWI